MSEKISKNAIFCIVRQNCSVGVWRVKFRCQA